MDNYVATNETFIKAYNEYLTTNNITQAMATGYAKLGDKVFPIQYDMFFDFLLVKIVASYVTNHEFIDPLASLYSANLSVGGVIEDKRTILLGKENDYSVKEFVTSVDNPFIKEKSGISVVYHKVNKHKLIKRTVSFDQIQEALLTEYGISDLVNAIIHDLEVEKDAWSYADKKKALLDPDYTTVVEYEDYADFNIKCKNIFVDFKNFDNSYKYNSSLIYSPMNESNILIIMSEKYKNEQDVKFFAGLFNVSYAEVNKQIMYIDEFPDNSVKAMILDRRGIYFKKTLDKIMPLLNPDDLTINYSSHFWRMHSVSPHYNAVVLKQKDTVVNATANVPQSYLATEAYDFTLTIPEGYECYYTTDGSMPTKSSTKYTNSVNITKSTVIKVLTVKTGTEPSGNYSDIRIYRSRFI